MKDNLKLQTLKIKAALISYFRFEKGHSLICTEFNYGMIDVLSLNNAGDEIYWVEVKANLFDLTRELKKTRYYRLKASDGESWSPNIYALWKPHLFLYFAISERLQSKAEIFCRENFPYAGLYILRDGFRCSSYEVTGIKTIIHAKALIPSVFFSDRTQRDLQERVIKGMANSLASVYSKLIEVKSRN